MYSSSSLDEIQNEATDEEDLFEQEQRPPTLSLAASDPKNGGSHHRPCLNSSSGPPSHELDRRDVGVDPWEKRAGELVMVSSSSTLSDLSHSNMQTGDCYGGEGGSSSSVYDEGNVAAESGRKDQVASPGAQHFSTPVETSCDMEDSENGRLLQPESFELLDISDFEDDVDDYHSDTSSLHVASRTPGSAYREESSDASRTSSLSSSQTSQSSNHVKTWLNTSQTPQKQGKHTPGTIRVVLADLVIIQ